MKRIDLLYILAAAGVGCAPLGPDEGGQSASPEGASVAAIVGGTLDSRDPAAVAFTVQGNQFCSGTLVNPQTVITAAHCIYSYGQQASYSVHFGTYSYSPSSTMGVVSQFRHPGYNGSEHDIGVLKLATPVLSVTPIALNPVALTSADVGKPIRHVGYGITTSGGGGGGVRREVTYNVRGISPGSIESGTAGKQTCGGDSGGTALMVTAGSPDERLVGVISYGDQDCLQFGVDSRVDVDLAWINQTAAAWEQPTCAGDGKCVQGCTPIDQDCACDADGVCHPGCTNLLKDPDCPRDCVQNAICALDACPAPDPDCVAEGGPCSSEQACRTRICVNDSQHPYYCSRACQSNAECSSGMECGPAKVCLFIQKPEVGLGEGCDANVHCKGSICTGPVEGMLRCATRCASGTECPASQSCEGGVDGSRYCRSPDPVIQPRTMRVIPRASEQLAAAEGCSAASGAPLGLALLTLVRLLARRRGAQR